MVVFTKQLMDLKVSSSVSPPWAVVLAVFVAGFLSTCATSAPLILQLDPTTLVGHRLVITIEPLLPKGVTHMNIESNTSVVLLNTTADVTNASIISFGSNSVDTPVTPDAPEMISADVTTKAGPPPTSTAAVMADSQSTVEVISQPLLRSEKSGIFADDGQLTNHIFDDPAQNFRKNNLGISFGTRTQIWDKDDVDNFLINIPQWCPDGWRLENGQCRRPFHGFNDIAKSRSNFHVFNDIAKPRSKTMLKRKIKMMALK